METLLGKKFNSDQWHGLKWNDNTYNEIRTKTKHFLPKLHWQHQGREISLQRTGVLAYFSYCFEDKEKTRISQLHWSGLSRCCYLFNDFPKCVCPFSHLRAWSLKTYKRKQKDTVIETVNWKKMLKINILALAHLWWLWLCVIVLLAIFWKTSWYRVLWQHGSILIEEIITLLFSTCILCASQNRKLFLQDGWWW